MATTQKISPCLWFNNQAEEAVNFYLSVFDNVSTGRKSYYGKEGFEHHQMPEGSLMTMEFQLNGYNFLALNGGPVFSFTPAISFFVHCKTEEEVEKRWEKLIEGGKSLMPLDRYPFSEKYGWVEDKYGVSWQLMLSRDVIKQQVVPSLMFVGDMNGKAESAIQFYTSIFKNSEVKEVFRYGPDHKPNQQDAVMFADFLLEGQHFAAMDSGLEHNFTFNEAVSFIVSCRNQEEIDYYWGKLSEGGDDKAQQCGWLKDQFGVSWQVVPDQLNEMLTAPDQEKAREITNLLFGMKKIDLEVLNEVYSGRGAIKNR